MRDPACAGVPAVGVAGAAAGAALMLAALAGCGGASPPITATATAPAPGWSAAPGQVAAEPTITPAPPHAIPVEVSIPSIGVHSRLDRLVMDPQGVLVAPREPGRAGWFADGVRPGDPGPAVIAGHLDSRTGAAVFAELPALRPGATVLVTGADHRKVTFSVEQVRTYPKSNFPTKDVYGATPDAQLRLITCGGGFDQSRGHYTDNVVVYASVIAG